MTSLFKPGTRTYILSAVALLCAVLLQAHTQGIMELAPMMKLILTLTLTIVAPLVPVYIRKAIAALEAGKSKARS